MATTQWSQEAGMVGGADMSNITTLVDQAEASAEAAIAAKEAIDGLYLGAQASDPTVDLNGDALTAGDWYFNTTDNVAKVWDGSEWNAIATNLSGDTSPALGGDLDGAGYSISGVNNLTTQDLSVTGTANVDTLVADTATISGGTITATLTGNVTGNVTGDLTGTVQTAAQPNITSLGTLTSASISGDLAVNTDTLFVDVSTSNVGIGTNAPTSALTVAGDIRLDDTFPQIVAQDTDDSTTQSISLGSGAIVFSADSGDAVGNSNIRFSVDGTEHVRIDSSGQVGINTTTPTSTLDVDGTVNVTGALTANTLEGDLSYTPNGTNAVTTTVQTKLTERVTPEDFGAVGDGVTDDRTAILRAIAYIGSIGGGTVAGVPGSTYRVSGILNIVDNITFYGLNIKKSSGSADDKVFLYLPPDPADGKSNISFINCTISGIWDENPRAVGENGLISLKHCSNILIKDCHFSHARFFGINITFCSNVKVINSDFLYITRDMCAVWNTPNVLIEGNTFLGNDDDVISVSTAGQAMDPVRDSIVIRNNIAKDTGGISTQLAKRMIIEGNIFDRCKGAFAIKLSATNSANDNNSAPQDVKVINNTITNQIDRSISTDGTPPTINFRRGIYIDGIGKTSIPASSPSTYPTYPDPATGAPVEPYGYFLTQNDPIRVPFYIVISGNTVTRQLPAATNYSDYGYGQVFTRFSTDTFAPTGFVDPEITDTLLQCLPLDVLGPLSNTLIDSNIFFGGSTTGIKFSDSDVAAADNDLRNVIVSNNLIGDASARGVDLLDYANTYQDLFIKNNVIDNDPYFRAVNRVQSGGVFTGGWSSNVSCLGIETSNVAGLKIYDNTFKNCSRAVRDDGVINQTRKRRNALISQPVAAGYNSGNLGVGSIPDRTEEEFEVIYTDCDPTSSNYGKILEQTNASDPIKPSSGFYHKGYVIKVNQINQLTRNGVSQTAFAYLRLTTGTGHVIGVDWQALYAEL